MTKISAIFHEPTSHLVKAVICHLEYMYCRFVYIYAFTFKGASELRSYIDVFIFNIIVLKMVSNALIYVQCSVYVYCFIIHIVQNFECDICGLVVKSKGANLRRHKLLHGPTVQRLKCLSCTLTFSSQFNFEQHCRRLHSEETTIVGTWVTENARRKKIIRLFHIFLFCDLSIFLTQKFIHRVATCIWTKILQNIYT